MLDSKHVQALSFFFFVATQGWNDGLKGCLYGGMDGEMFECVGRGKARLGEWLISGCFNEAAAMGIYRESMNLFNPNFWWVRYCIIH